MGFTLIVLVVVVFGDEPTTAPQAAPAEARKPRLEQARPRRRRVRRLEAYRLQPPLRMSPSYLKPARYQQQRNDSAETKSVTPVPQFQSNRSKYLPADPKTWPYWIAGLVVLVLARLFFGGRK